VDFTPADPSIEYIPLTNTLTKIFQNPNFRATLSGFTISDWYLNASWAWNFLKYDLSKLNLKDDFAVEMRVKLDEILKTSSSINYLLDLVNSDLIIENKEIGSTLSNSTYQNISKYLDNNFHTIILRNNWEISIDWDKFDTEIFTEKQKISGDLYVWVNYDHDDYVWDSYSRYFNNKIDYIKIYNKK